MIGDFDTRVKKVERELTDLKTATSYTSIRSANYLTGVNVSTGLYRVTFEDTDEVVFSMISVISGKGSVNGRIPENNIQEIEVYTQEYSQESDTVIYNTVEIAIASNSSVVTIDKIS